MGNKLIGNVCNGNSLNGIRLHAIECTGNVVEQNMTYGNQRIGLLFDMDCLNTRYGRNSSRGNNAGGGCAPGRA